MHARGGLKSGGRGAATGLPRTDVRAKGFEASTSAGETTAKEASQSSMGGGVVSSVKEGQSGRNRTGGRGRGKCPTLGGEPEGSIGHTGQGTRIEGSNHHLL